MPNKLLLPGQLPRWRLQNPNGNHVLKRAKNRRIQRAEQNTQRTERNVKLSQKRMRTYRQRRTQNLRDINIEEENQMTNTAIQRY